jgi:predicted Holliday junction resolvase-like endonuclease
MRTISLLISIDFDCFKVLFIVTFSKLNCRLLQTAANSMQERVIQIHMLEARVKQLEKQVAEKEAAKDAAEKEAAEKEEARKEAVEKEAVEKEATEKWNDDEEED